MVPNIFAVLDSFMAAVKMSHEEAHFEFTRTMVGRLSRKASLGSVGVSYGKGEVTGSGSGLGIFHAKKAIVAWGGEFQIRSQVASGTTVEIKLLNAPRPHWFASSIQILEGTTVVSVDDDLSIHQIWKGRLESIKAQDSSRLEFSAYYFFEILLYWHLVEILYILTMNR